MQDAQHFRNQAELCLTVARQVSDRRLAESLREDADHYFRRASKLDTQDKKDSDIDGPGRRRP